MRGNRKFWMLVIVVLSMALMSACSSNNGNNENAGKDEVGETSTNNASDGGSDGEKELTIAIGGDIQNFNPYTNQAVDYFTVRYNVFESLVQFDTSMNVVAGLAKEWTVEDDRITFMLNDGVTFHDGSPLTVEDVRYSIEMVQDEANASYHAPYFADVASVEGSGGEVIINLSNPNPVMLSNFANLPIIKNGSFEQQSNDPIGTGAFQFESWSAGDRIVLSKYPDYWRGNTTNVDKLIIRPISDPAVRLSNLISGTIDMVASLQSNQFDQIENREGYSLLKPTSSNQTTLVEVVLNNHEAFQNPQVMKALVHALDKATIKSNVYKGYGKTLWSPFPSNNFGYREGEEIAYDLDEAKRLLAEAGYADGFTFSMILPTGFSDLEQIAVIWAHSLEQIGVTMNIERMELNSWIDAYVARSYQMSMNIYPQAGNDSAVYANLIMLPLIEKSLPDPSHLKSLIEQASSTMDESKRIELYAEIQDVIAEQMPIIPIQETPIAAGISDQISGVDIYPTSAIYFGNAQIKE